VWSTAPLGPGERAATAKADLLLGPVSIPAVSVQPVRHRFSVDDYYRMAETGVLNIGDHVELIDGEILEMSPIGSRHAGCVNRMAAMLSAAVERRAIVSVQNPVRLSELSEAQPDVALLRPRDDWYSAGHPGPADTLLVVEVAETSLAFDRDVKRPLYAAAGLEEMWLVNLLDGCVEVASGPEAGGYRRIDTFAAGAAVAPNAFPDLSIQVDEILP